MSTENNANRQGQGGSGSAENIGKTRQEQKAQLTGLNDQQKQDIADQTGLEPEDVLSLQQTGATSGRDDAAGGSGDNMEATSSNEATDKL